MRRKLLLILLVAFLSIPAFSTGAREIPSDAVMANPVSDEMSLPDYSENTSSLYGLPTVRDTSLYDSPDPEYDVPVPSPDGKYVAMFSYKYGVLLMNLQSEDSVHIIATYETRPQYWPLYTSAFWSEDSETLFIESNSKVYFVKMHDLFDDETPLDFEKFNQIAQQAAAKWSKRSEALWDYIPHADGEICVYISDEDTGYLLYCETYAYTSMYKIHYYFVIDDQNVVKGYSQRYDYEEPYTTENCRIQEKEFFSFQAAEEPTETAGKLASIAYSIYQQEISVSD